MRKNVMASGAGLEPQENWLDIPALASADVTSEDPNFPLENLFTSEEGPGWRAAVPGEQLIRLRFDSPQRIRRIRLEFADSESERTQEFALRWSADGSRTLREIVRQQWNFSPRGSTRETEDYDVDLSEVCVLELSIKPDVGGGPARASCERWKIA